MSKMTLTPKQKIRLALERVGRDHPITVPVVIGNWKVVPCPDGVIPSGPNKGCPMPTMATDGRHLWYNESFVDELSLEISTCIVGHETGHPLFKHQFRCNGRNSRLWNIAADLAINDNLRDWYQGFVSLDKLLATGSMMPEFGSYMKYPRNKCAEEYYNMILDDVKEEQEKQKEQQEQQKGNQSDEQGDADNDSQGNGEVSDEVDTGDDSTGSSDNQEKDDVDQGVRDAAGNKDDGEGDQSGEENGGENDSDGTEGGDEANESSGSQGEGEGNQSIDEAIDKLFGDKAGTKDDPFGTVEQCELDANEDEDEEDAERLFDEAIQQAVVTCKAQGMCAGSLMTGVGNNLLKDADHENKMNWRAMLQRFISRLSSGGSTFRRPHRRHSHRRDVIIPANMGRGKSKGLVIVDTSGSMGDQECNEALRQIEQIVRIYPKTTVKLISCDTSVIEGKEYRVTDFPIDQWEGWKGRGGTDLAPAMKWAEQYRPEWMVIVTDMCWSWWDEESTIPTIWLGITVPYGYKQKIEELLPFGNYAEVSVS